MQENMPPLMSMRSCCPNTSRFLRRGLHVSRARGPHRAAFTGRIRHHPRLRRPFRRLQCTQLRIIMEISFGGWVLP
ncbi:hypothetical protein DM860_003330 [Cuscuta australis]|uniref:Uncharacterized protein n=1 Tax=Cuscuta australis TaxID=267555 RepID=A0A328DK64_9ASTE|nr:hypothetical protein DM860_003330 [Cuscuta australis]